MITFSVCVCVCVYYVYECVYVCVSAKVKMAVLISKNISAKDLQDICKCRFSLILEIPT